MFCPSCGRQNADNVSFCGACGKPLAGSAPAQFAQPGPAPYAPAAPMTAAAQAPNPGFEQHSVILLYVLSCVTGGIFAYYWLITRSKIANTLQSTRKVSIGAFIGAIVMLGIFIILYIAGVALLMAKEPETGVVLLCISMLLALIAGIIVLVQVFNFRAALIEHFRDVPGVEINGVLTFFFSFMYLQYKINKLFFGVDGW